jgi:hypothetical protein
MALSWKKILKAYIEHIEHEEGTNFLYEVQPRFGPLRMLSPEEHKALNDLADEDPTLIILN